MIATKHDGGIQPAIAHRTRICRAFPDDFLADFVYSRPVFPA